MNVINAQARVEMTTAEATPRESMVAPEDFGLATAPGLPGLLKSLVAAHAIPLNSTEKVFVVATPVEASVVGKMESIIAAF